MFGTLNKIYTFIGASSKRNSVFERVQKELNVSSSTLKSLSETRWSCRIEFTRNTIGQERLTNIAILNIEKLYPINFDTIINEFNAEQWRFWG